MFSPSYAPVAPLFRDSAVQPTWLEGTKNVLRDLHSVVRVWVIWVEGLVLFSCSIIVPLHIEMLSLSIFTSSDQQNGNLCSQ